MRNDQERFTLYLNFFNVNFNVIYYFGFNVLKINKKL